MSTHRLHRLAVLLCALAASPAHAEDCNGNGVDDALDIAFGTSLDENGDGIPDECQRVASCDDCDGDGIVDAEQQAAKSGLAGEYWITQAAGNFTERVLSRIDPNVEFQWSGGSPDPSIPNDNFTVRWTGTITAPASGSYTFWTTTDDGVRLWIGDALLIDKWQPQSPTTWSGTTTLVAGARYAFRMEYYEAGGGAEARLEWRVPGGVREIVPGSAFEPLVDLDGDGWADACGDCDGNGVIDAQELVDGTGVDCNGNCLLDACEIAQASTAAYWRFDEVGATTPDAGAGGLTGAVADAAASGDIGVLVVPAIGEANLGSIDLGPAGRVVAADPARTAASDGGSITIEAWVKLGSVASGATAAERRTLVQRKPFDGGDKLADYMLLVQGGDMPTTGLQNWGRTGNYTGRELVLVFGTGGAANAAFWTITSNLRVDDTGWHYIAASYDETTREARFVVDDQAELFIVPGLGRVTVDASVVVGAHTNAQGAFNQFTRGLVDELRISHAFLEPDQLLVASGLSDCNGNGILDVCDIRSGTSLDCNKDGVPNECEPDCNGNGFPDACDIASGAAQDCNGDSIPDACQLAGNDCNGDGIPDDCQIESNDCNGNGLPDDCDLFSGASADCNGDSVPDECQLGEPFSYRIDDGGAEFGIRSFGTHMCWLSQFRVERGAGLVEALEMNFVFLPDGATTTVGIWSDPNGDGRPDDAQLLASKVVPTFPLGVTRVIDMPDTPIGPDGTSFFIGAYMPVGANDYPGPLDTSGNAILGRCWIIGAEGPIDPSNIGGTAATIETIEEALFPGKWIARALSTTTESDCNGNGVLDACDIAAGISVDADGSGRPDECEDCNLNGVLDSIDLSKGLSEDCNGDGLPDECQLYLGDCDANGVIDECELEGRDCNGNGLPDSCDLANGISEDLDGTGVPDECEDCNANGTLDSADIALGTSLDCNADLVPDECQLGEPVPTAEYLLDDGTREGNYGGGNILDFVWLNQFSVEAGGEWIAEIGVVLGNAFSGVPYEVILWSDPNGDGLPDDAQVVARAPAIAANGNTDTFNWMGIAPTYVGPEGTSFFAGVLYRDDFGNQFPLGVDTNSTVSQRTWVAIDSTVDPNALSLAGVYGALAQANGLVRAYGFDGGLPNDCDRNDVPDDCDIAAGAADANGNGVLDCCETGTCDACPADLDRNGVVEAPDLAVLLGAWGTADGDLDGDGSTNAQDLAILLGAWGACP